MEEIFIDLSWVNYLVPSLIVFLLLYVILTKIQIFSKRSYVNAFIAFGISVSPMFLDAYSSQLFYSQFFDIMRGFGTMFSLTMALMFLFAFSGKEFSIEKLQSLKWLFVIMFFSSIALVFFKNSSLGYLWNALVSDAFVYVILSISVFFLTLSFVFSKKQ